DRRSRFSFSLVAEDRLAPFRDVLPRRHRNPAGTVQTVVQLPEITTILLARHDVALAGEHFPIVRLDLETAHRAGRAVNRDAIELVFELGDRAGRVGGRLCSSIAGSTGGTAAHRRKMVGRISQRGYVARHEGDPRGIETS